MDYVFNIIGMLHDRDDSRSFFRTLIYVSLDPYVVFYGLSWILIRISRNLNETIPFFNNWLTDFVFVPLILHFTSIIGLFVRKSWQSYQFPLWQILFICTYISIFYEWFAPQVTSYNIADWGDVMAYFLGGLFYYYVHNPYLSKKLKFPNQHNIVMIKTLIPWQYRRKE